MGLCGDFVQRRAAAGVVAVCCAAGLGLGGCEKAGGAGGAGGAASPGVASGEGQQPPGASAGAGPTAQIEVAAGGIDRQSPSNALPPVRFDPALLDFGFIAPGVNSKGDISITNTGDAPLKILRATPTCACTTLTSVDGVVLAPGGSTVLTVRLDGRELTGPRKASIKVACDGYSQTADVDLVAEVTLAIRALPAIFNLAPRTGEDGARIPGPRTGTVVVESLDGNPFNILSANGESPVFDGYDPDIDEPSSRYVLQWDLSWYADAELPRWWVVETDREDCPLVLTWVRHPATIELPPRERNWRVEQRYALVGLIEPGHAKEFTAEVRALGQDSIYSVRSLSGDFDAELVKVTRDGPNGQATVRITPKPHVLGVFQGRIEYMASVFTQKVDVIGKVGP
jgi:hypothetical protein